MGGPRQSPKRRAALHPHYGGVAPFIGKMRECGAAPGTVMLNGSRVNPCNALMGHDTRLNHARRFAYNTAAGVTWIWTAVWAMRWLHG